MYFILRFNFLATGLLLMGTLDIGIRSLTEEGFGDFF